MNMVLDPATPQGFLLLWVRTRIDRVRSEPVRGASAIEWVIITAVLVAIAGAIGVILFRVINTGAEQIKLPPPPG